MSDPALHLSIVIPTYKRPEGLARAMESIIAQRSVNFDNLELVIVDNDPEASAKETVQRFDTAPLRIEYVHEPNPGVANARNAGVAAIRYSLMAYLDDDQTAPDDWLCNLLTHYEQHKAAVTFGPVETALPSPGLPHEAYLKTFFERKRSDDAMIIDTFYGCGNALLDLEQMPISDEPLFDVISNEIGGEDDFLFARVQRDGGKFGWAAKAYVYEHVPAARAHIGYTLRRSFGYGQGPSTIAMRKTPKDRLSAAFWMMVGAGQSLVFGTAALVMMALRSKRRAFMYDRAVQGLGKLFWFGIFEQKFYGQYAS